jgi:pyruvate kinase
MLSNETTQGKYPVETIAMMAKILDEVIHRGFKEKYHPL